MLPWKQRGRRRPYLHHRVWWFGLRTPLLWTTFRGCINYEHQLTWRDA